MNIKILSYHLHMMIRMVLIKDKVRELDGTEKSHTDDIYTILEMHVDLDIEGFEDRDPMGEPTGIKLPYIVTP